MSKCVAVLGASGMLGSMVADVLASDRELQVVATVRSTELADAGRARLPDVTWSVLDSLDERSWGPLEGIEWCINAIGITKPLIHDNIPGEIEYAISVNSAFPHVLARRIESWGGRVIQIATDCVFSGAQGGYVESDSHDALDAYGKTKSLGESWYPNIHHLRCSIIGPEPKDKKFLLEWFLGQAKGATVNGFTNHRWNGVTTLQFARLCHSVIMADSALPHLQHVVPEGTVTKAEMLAQFAAAYDRDDIVVNRIEADYIVDRTLRTTDQAANLALWQGAGYERVPTVGEMIYELAQFPPRLVSFTK